MKYACVGNTGEGKTLAIVLEIYKLYKKDPSRPIYANFHINIPGADFHFTPIMFLPFDKLKSCIIAFDDVSTQEILERFIGTCANRSRKEWMDLFFTCQYYTMIPRKLRKMIDYRIFPNFNKKNDTLTIRTIQKKKGLLTPETYFDIIKYIKKTKLYNTNEVVDDPTESEVIAEIVRISTTPRDIEKNLMIYTGNKAERKTLYKEIYELKGFDKAEKEALRKKKEKEAKIRQQKYIAQKNLMVNFLVDNINLNESKTYIQGKLYEKLDTFKSKVFIQFDDFSEIIMRAIAIFRDREIENSLSLGEKNTIPKKKLEEERLLFALENLNSNHDFSIMTLNEISGISESKLYRNLRRIKNYKKNIKDKYESLALR